MKEINVSIITPEGVFFHGDAEAVIVRGAEGYLGIRHDHTPLVTSIVPGKLRLHTKEGKQREALLSGGILDAQPENVKIISDTARWV